MARRTKLIGFVGFSWMAVSAVLYFLTRDPHANAWERYRHIQIGMSESDVIAAFGASPGTYSSIDVECCGTGQDNDIAAVNGCHAKRVWVFDRGIFQIGFDREMRVEHMVALANMNRPSAFARLMHLFDN